MIFSFSFYYPRKEKFTNASTFKFIIQGWPPEFTSTSTNYEHGCKFKRTKTANCNNILYCIGHDSGKRIS